MKTILICAAFTFFVSSATFGVNNAVLLADAPAAEPAKCLEKADLARQGAAEARKAGDFQAERKAMDEEVSQLEGYLAKSPDDVDVQERYGLLLAECIHNAEKYASALEVLDRVVERDAGRTATRKKLIDLLIAWRRYNDACTHLESLLKETPDDAESLTQLGRCLLAMSRSEKAKESLEKAIAISAKQVDAYRYLSYLLRQRSNRPKDADALMEKMIAANADSAEAHCLMSEYLLEVKAEALDPKEALRHAEKALALNPEHLAASILAAKCRMAGGDLEGARECARRIFEQHKRPDGYREDLYFLLAEIERRANSRAKAQELLQEGFKETKNLQFLWMQTLLKIDDKDFDGAGKLIKQLAALNFEETGLEYLRGKIFFMQGKWRDAVRTFENARPYINYSPDLLKMMEFYLGACYGQLLNADQQIAAYRRALAIDPRFEPALQSLAEALPRAKKSGTAAGEAELTPENTKTLSARMTLIRLLIEKKRRLPETEQHWEEVEKLIDRSAKDFPDSPQIALYRCEALDAEGRFEEVEKLLGGLLEKDPKNFDYWNGLLSFAMRRKQWEKAEETLRNFEKAVGDTVEARLSKADYYLRRYAAEAGPHLAQLEAKSDHFTDVEKCSLWSGLLNAAVILGDKESIARLSALLAKKDPDNLQMQLLRLDQAIDAADDAGLAGVLGDIERIEGKGPFWLYGQAVLISCKVTAGGDPALLDDALKHLEQARMIRESWSKIPLLMGQIYDQKKDFSLAMKYYLEGIDRGDHNAAAMLRVGQLLYRRQSYKQIDDLLSRWSAERLPFTVELSQLWAETLLQAGKFDSALEKARKIAAENDGDYRKHLWHGQMAAFVAEQTKRTLRFWEVYKFYGEAEKAYRRAVELKGDLPETLTQLVCFLMAIRKRAEAEAAFEAGREKIRGNAAPFALAQCFEAFGKIAATKTQYGLALTAAPDDPAIAKAAAAFYYRQGDVAEAELLWKKIVAGKEIKAQDFEVMQARRGLASLLLKRGGDANRQEAHDHIAANLEFAPDLAADKRLLIAIDSQDPRPGRRKEAIRALEELRTFKLADREDLALLVDLYLADDNWQKAAEVLRQLQEAYPRELRYAALHVKQALKHGDLREAEQCLPTLLKTWPNHAQAAFLQAELLLRREQFDDALELMKGFAIDPKGIPADRGQRMFMTVSMMEEFIDWLKTAGQPIYADRFARAAERELRQFVDEHPAAILHLATFLARQEHYEDATDVLEKYWKSASPMDLAQIGTTVARGGKGSKAVVGRVMQVLYQAHKQYLGDKVISLTMGDIYLGAGMYPQAESWYREILKSNPDYIAVLNNLVVLLTLKHGSPNESLALINKAIEIAGPQAVLLDTRACVYIARGEADKALADLAEVLADAKKPERLFHLAQAFELAGQARNAALAMKEALDKGLSEKSLFEAELPVFHRLQKMVQELPPPKEEDVEPPYVEDTAACPLVRPSFNVGQLGQVLNLS